MDGMLSLTQCGERRGSLGWVRGRWIGCGRVGLTFPDEVCHAGTDTVCTQLGCTGAIFTSSPMLTPPFPLPFQVSVQSVRSLDTP